MLILCFSLFYIISNIELNIYILEWTFEDVFEDGFYKTKYIFLFFFILHFIDTETNGTTEKITIMNNNR